MGIKSEEKLIIGKLGRRNPFKVPEGYFDTFAREFISELPERESQAVSQKPARIVSIALWRRVACAACVLIAALCTSLYLVNSDRDDAIVHTESVSQEEYMEMVADYAMMDNHDIYACITEE